MSKIKTFLLGVFNTLYTLMPSVILAHMVYMLYQGDWTISKIMSFLFLCVLCIKFAIEDSTRNNDDLEMNCESLNIDLNLTEAQIGEVKKIIEKI